jgi:hypothetical protein
MKMKTPPINGKRRRPNDLPPGTLDKLEDEIGGDFKETLPATGDQFCPSGDGRAADQSSPMTMNIVNIELVTGTGPTMKRVSAAIEMWISIPGRYSSYLSLSWVGASWFRPRGDRAAP